jgi:prefoldin alpha subunit
MQQEIDLEAIPIEQLSQIKQLVQTDIESLSQSMSQLRIARDRYLESKGAIARFSAGEKDQPLMVPLTSSLYASGKIRDPKHVLVDVGTNFYVQKEGGEAVKLMDRKIGFLREGMQKLQEVVIQKRKQLELIVNVLRQRLAALQESEGKE